MSLLVTDAIVLHMFDYLETSRILRLATRDAGVQSVLAKGARRSSRRFGTALDLFASGSAQLHVKVGRDLHTLGAFDVERQRAGIAMDLDRFTAASALAELVLRFARDDASPSLYDTLVAALDDVATAPEGAARAIALAGAWRLVAELGFAPSVDSCIVCHDGIAPELAAAFSHPGGGALCARCVRLHRSSRTLPPEARAALRAWLGGAAWPVADAGEARAHQRLLREFLVEHLSDGHELRAFEVWERDQWTAS